MKILDKDPEKRYPDGKSFVYALEGAFAADADADTHDIEGSEPTVESVRDMKTSPILLPKDDSKPSSQPLDTSMDDIPTISDSSRAKPGSLPFSPLDEDKPKADDVPAKPATQDSSGNNGLLYGGIAAVIVLAIVAGVILLSGGGGNGDDDENSANVNGTQTAVALAVAEDVAPDVTNTPTETPQPTNTPTSTPDEPTDTPEPTVTETLAPTDTPEPTVTETSEPTETPTSTPTPTPDFTPTFSAALLTPEGPDDPNELVLRYDGRTLVMYNRAPRNVNVLNISFDGNGRNFRARDWNQNINTLASMRPTRCYQVYTILYRSWLPSDPPADICSFRDGFESTVSNFWTSRDSVDGLTFVVRNNGEPLAECPLAPWNSEDELYCFVDLDAADSTDE